MIVLLNGSFGVGKSTVAGLLRNELPGSRIYDPEIVGSILMRLPRWIKLRGAHMGDFQNIDLWRKSVSAGIRLTQSVTSGPIIVPMAFDRHDYLDEISRAIRHFDTDLRIFCLHASLSVIKQRLVSRGTPSEGPEAEWIARRIVECVAAHRDPAFGVPIDTESQPAQEVVKEILAQLHTNAQ